jgi:hypothetical protein
MLGFVWIFLLRKHKDLLQISKIFPVFIEFSKMQTLNTHLQRPALGQDMANSTHKAGRQRSFVEIKRNTEAA